MMKRVPPLVGYVTPMAATSGQSLDFKISSSESKDFTAEVLRLFCVDPNPAGPGMNMQPVDFGVADHYKGIDQKCHLGSCALADIGPFQQHEAIKLSLIFSPRVVSDARQTIACLQDEVAAVVVSLALQNDELVLCFSDGGGDSVVRTGYTALELRRFYMADLVVQTNTVSVALRRLVTPRDPVGDIDDVTRTYSTPFANLVSSRLSHVCLAGVWRGCPTSCFNGLIESPQITVRDMSAHAIDWLPHVRWDLASDMQCQTVCSEVSLGRTLSLINAPTRAIRSSVWDGTQMCWSSAPSHYCAVAFHEDDVGDCDWRTVIRLCIPEHAISGVYGLRISNNDGYDIIPFYVVPEVAKPSARIAFLASTFTYQAYANHARGNFDEMFKKRVAKWQAYPYHPDEFGGFGASTYNLHPDGTGISLSTRHRPILTMRPGYLTFDDPSGSGLRHFPADSHIVDWLQAKGFDVDVITDECLDDHGVRLLAPYSVVITGSHPEYHTRRTIDALRLYRKGGGNFMYLGGNGFYWKIARNAEQPDLIEVRRAEGGIRAWASEPGEYYNQLDAEYGGLWRRNGVAPQVVGGVGFVVQGNFEGSYYVRTPASDDPELAWLFDGIDERKLGDFGLSGGGAAGFELDQFDVGLGSHPKLRIVATSEIHGELFRVVPEELLTWTMDTSGDRAYGGVRAHMVYGEMPNGSKLFACGSITFAGSLSHNNHDNNISRLLENCLRRLAMPKPDSL